MPLPWKKSKVTRISRLVADLHQSPKRGGSLVVETGFPTSLIDLFVKNRDRLRKSPKRKSNSSSQIQSPSPDSPPLHPSSPSPSKAEVGVRSLAVDVRTECENKASFRSALAILLAVALAVSTRFFAVRIMALAFLLVIMQFVGRFFVISESKNLLWGSWIGKGCLVFKRLDWKQISSSTEEIVVDSLGLNELKETCSEEIEIADSEIGRSESEKQIGSVEMQVTIEKKEKRGKMLISKTERARMKASLIKKFVPKKIRNGKRNSKYQDESSSQSAVQLEKLEIMDEEKQVTNVNTETGLGKEENCIQDGIGDVMKEMNDEKKVKTCGYLILFMIVLGGLVGGKCVALLLTLLWCLMVRYIGRTRKCYVLSENKV